MEINERKHELTAHLQAFERASKELERKHKKYFRAFLFFALLNTVYVLFVLSVILRPYSDAALWLFFGVINITYFFGTLFFDHRILRRYARDYNTSKSKCNNYFVILVDYLDWTAYRNKQSYGVVDPKILSAIRDYNNHLRYSFDPQGRKYKILHAILSFVLYLTLAAGIFIFIYTYKSNVSAFEFGLSEQDVLLGLIVAGFSLIISILFFILSVLKYSPMVNCRYHNQMKVYFTQLTAFCKYITEFSQCVRYTDESVEYVRDIKMLMNFFVNLGKELCVVEEKSDYNKLDATTLEHISEKLLRLSYCVKEKIHYTEDGLTLGTDRLSENKNEIRSQIEKVSPKYITNSIDWTTTWHLADEMYSSWQKYERLPGMFEEWLKMDTFYMIVALITIILLMVTIVYFIFWGYSSVAITPMALFLFSFGLFCFSLYYYQNNSYLRRYWLGKK